MENLEIMNNLTPDPSFWAGKRVLVTGHSGFKGGWLVLWLVHMGAKVTGIGLSPFSKPNLYDLAKISSLCDSRICDIRDANSLQRLIQAEDVDIVFHLAAQSLVRPGYLNPIETFTTNLNGTINLLEAMRSSGTIRVGIIVTTDKVYKNREWIWPYRESDELGGTDPYSASKVCAEIAVECYRKSFLDECNISISTVRAGNVIGGGDWSVDRLLPDAIRAWNGSQILTVRNPYSTRPWQYVLEPLAGYLILAQKMFFNSKLSGPYNFGPKSDQVYSVKDVIEFAKGFHKSSRVEYLEREKNIPEAGELSLDSSKSQRHLGVGSRLDLYKSIEKTMNWYGAQSGGSSMTELCFQEINAYSNILS